MNDRDFRNAMGKFATGVTVVTTTVNGQEHGMTANAFMSVSLNPKLVVISVGEKARMNDLIRQSGKFAVNILSSKQQEISMRFAGQKKAEEPFLFDTLAELPVIPNALAQVACTVVNAYVEGDHTLYIGKVTELQLNDGDPLLFFAGSYRDIAISQEQTIS